MSSDGTTVVIAAFNAENTIRTAIHSAMNQERRPFEIVVVDDGSVDNTRAEAIKAGARVISQPNGGPAVARNRGAAGVFSRYVLFLDADDELLPNAIEVLEHAFRAFPEAAVVSGAHMYSGADGQVRRPSAGVVAEGRRVALLKDFYSSACVGPIAAVGAVLIKKEAFTKIGGFDTRLRLGEDIDLWGRCAGVFQWAFVDEPVFIYNHSPVVSSTFRTPASQKPTDYLMSESRMKAQVCEALWPSYRAYRRKLATRQARAALHDGAARQARELLKHVSPVPVNADLLVTTLLAYLPKRLARCVLRASTWTRARVRPLWGVGSRLTGRS